MHLLKTRSGLHRIGGLGLLAIALLLLTACGGGGASDPTATVQVAETAAPSGPTPDDSQDLDPTATAEPDPTNTPEATSTPTPSPTPVPPTATPTVTPTPTPTPLPTVESPFSDARAVVDTLENFTLSYNARFSGADDEETVDLLIEQFSPDSYHLRVSTGGQQTEAWRSGETIHVLGPGGAVVELPGLVDRNLYAPSSFVVLVPDLAAVGIAIVVDENSDVDGRPAIHYRLEPAAASAFLPADREAGDDVEGTFEVWVDQELEIVLRLDADVEWTGPRREQSMQMEYLVSEIGTTPEVHPPG